MHHALLPRVFRAFVILKRFNSTVVNKRWMIDYCNDCLSKTEVKSLKKLCNTRIKWLLRLLLLYPSVTYKQNVKNNDRARA